MSHSSEDEEEFFDAPSEHDETVINKLQDESKSATIGETAAESQGQDLTLTRDQPSLVDEGCADSDTLTKSNQSEATSSYETKPNSEVNFPRNNHMQDEWDDERRETETSSEDYSNSDARSTSKSSIEPQSNLIPSSKVSKPLIHKLPYNFPLENRQSLQAPQIRISGKIDGSSESQLPLRPPRRKKRNNTDEPLTASNITSLVDEIVSIKGDLSVTEAILAHGGDRRSICIDELMESRGATANQRLQERIDEKSKCEPEPPPPSIKSNIPEIVSTLASETKEMKPVPSGDLSDKLTVLNLNTGERVPIDAPLTEVEQAMPKCLNHPLNYHLMKITNSLTEEDSKKAKDLIREGELDEDDEEETEGRKQRLKNVKKELGRGIKKLGTGIVKGFHGVKHRGSSNALQGAETPTEAIPMQPDSQSLQSAPPPPSQMSTSGIQGDHIQACFKLKTNHKRKCADFEGLQLIQELPHHFHGAVWCMKWSLCGQLLAVAGQDHLLRVYCHYKAWKYFAKMRNKASGQQTSPNSTREREPRQSIPRSGSISSNESGAVNMLSPSSYLGSFAQEDEALSEEGPLLLFSDFQGHTADILDISWSKNHFLLSSSMDKTVRLWHVSRVECLCTFRHIDFVTTIQFHPRDDRYFLSGSLDGKLRLWNIPDKKVAIWNEVMALPVQTKSGSSSIQSSEPAHGLITASAFVQNGKFAVIGTYDGRVIFYSTDQLKYFTQLHVSGRGLGVNNTSDRRRRKNNKVTGIESVDDNKILVTTNDSRIRLYDLRDLSLTCKFKGYVNESSQIRASVSHDNKFVVSGSENASFYIWRLHDETAIRRDKNSHWEQVRLLPTTVTQTTSKPHNMATNDGQGHPTTITTRIMPTIVTAAVFAPQPQLIDPAAKYVIATADFNGTIRIFAKM